MLIKRFISSRSIQRDKRSNNESIAGNRENSLGDGHSVSVQAQDFLRFFKSVGRDRSQNPHAIMLKASSQHWVMKNVSVSQFNLAMEMSLLGVSWNSWMSIRL